MKSPSRPIIRHMASAYGPPAIITGTLAAFVGFASSFAVVLQGLRAAGASEQLAASGLMAAAIAMGLAGIVLSLRTKMPISCAWSTPGAALLALGVGGATAANQPDFAASVGSFIICGLLIVLAGLWKPLAKAVARIPGPLANAMLAGILLSLCLAPFRAIAFDWALGLPILVAWVIGTRINRYLGVPFALVAFVVVLIFGVPFPDSWLDRLSAALMPEPVFTMPRFELASILSVGLPLFIVTMASQNIPGLAVLKANNYTPTGGPLISATGVFSLLAAPFGSLAVNLAAITAAMMASDDAGPDPAKRYGAAVICGVVYIIFGLFAGTVVAFVTLAPAVLIEAVAGLALIGAFSTAALAAFKDEALRIPAAVTFLASASGLTLFGVGGAPWGLLVGVVLAAVQGHKFSKA
ncbi:MAG: benzoate/H(+) symporter BenE family transporter [Pseudomonadota bacterium]